MPTWKILFEQSPVGIAKVSLDGTFIEANPKFQEIVGYTNSELEKLKFSDITHPADVDADVETLKKVRDGVIDSYEMLKRYITKNQRIIWVRLNVGKVVDEITGETEFYVSHVQPLINGEKLAASKAAALADSETKVTLSVGQFISDNWKSFIVACFSIMVLIIPIAIGYNTRMKSVDDMEKKFNKLIEQLENKENLALKKENKAND